MGIRFNIIRVHMGLGWPSPQYTIEDPSPNSHHTESQTQSAHATRLTGHHIYNPRPPNPSVYRVLPCRRRRVLHVDSPPPSPWGGVRSLAYPPLPPKVPLSTLLGSLWCLLDAVARRICEYYELREICT